MEKSSAAHVLVFDSGVGGLSIVEHIREILPAVSITYLADNRYFPYGLMNDSDLTERVQELITGASEIYRPDIIVVACNSASTLVLPTLRASLTIPIVGVVPAIKPAAQISESKVIGLLATPGTIRRDYTDELIAEFAPECKIIRVGSSELVQLVEQSLQGVEYPASALADVMAPFFAAPEWPALDTMVLACTHFPLLQPQLASIAPNVTHWVDSGEAIAKRVQSLINETAIDSSISRENLALFTGHKPNNDAMSAHFERFGLGRIASFP